MYRTLIKVVSSAWVVSPTNTNTNLGRVCLLLLRFSQGLGKSLRYTLCDFFVEDSASLSSTRWVPLRTHKSMSTRKWLWCVCLWCSKSSLIHGHCIHMLCQREAHASTQAIMSGLRWICKRSYLVHERDTIHRCDIRTFPFPWVALSTKCGWEGGVVQG